MIILNRKTILSSFERSVCPVGIIDPARRVLIYSNERFERELKIFQLVSGDNIFYDSKDFIGLMEKASRELSLQGYHDKNIDKYIELLPIYLKDDEENLHLVLQCSIFAFEIKQDIDFEPRFLESLPGNLWACSPNGEVFWTSKRSNIYACGVPDVPNLEHVGHIEKIHPDDVQMAFEKLSTGIADGFVEQYNYRFLSHQGYYEWFTLQMEPVHGLDGEVKYWLANSVNINPIMQELDSIKEEKEKLKIEIKEAENLVSAAQKMDLIAHLVGGIAHDLNNMLFVMRMHMGSLLKRSTDEQSKSMVQSVQECIARAARLSTQISAFSGRMPQNAQALAPEKMLEDVYQILSRAVGAEVSFHIHVEQGLPQVMADRAYLENALINLLINARDAGSGRGTVNLIVKNATRKNSDGITSEYVSFKVQDKGIGMSPELQKKIFDPFFTTKPIGKGTGLGLAMVKNFVENSKGLLEVDSQLGVGTTISVILPVALDEDVPIKLSAPMMQELAQGVGTVLLIEDDEDVRKVVSSILREHGYRIVAALNPDHAIGLLQAGIEVDLIVSDLRMPGKRTILDLIHYVEAHDPTPIIFITGYSADLVIEEGLLQDRYPVLFKPFEAYELLEKMEAMINNQTVKMLS